MALRPTELQIILAATRDIEKVQQLAQQQPRLQQELLISQFQHEIEDRKRQAQAVAKPEQTEIKKVELEGEQAENPMRRKKRRAGDEEREDREKPRQDDHIIDFLI